LYKIALDFLNLGDKRMQKTVKKEINEDKKEEAVEQEVKEIQKLNRPPELNKNKIIILPRTNNKMKILTSLPLKKIKKGIRRTGSFRIQFSEYMHIFRPVIYAIHMRLVGEKSYKPFLLSLVIDVIC